MIRWHAVMQRSLDEDHFNYMSGLNRFAVSMYTQCMRLTGSFLKMLSAVLTW